ncbi:MAG: 2-oxo acid dehydrogenase subunit E2 [Flavobacteriia bacterium]|nr:2-oxo acid dehydrogenase subunit E2 [Flavobacteriia bacterium]
MAKFELRLPQMGESVAEATLISWLKEVGDVIEQDEAVLEIATDKVDTEVPSEVSGVLVEKKFQEDDLVQVGDIIAIIEVDASQEQAAETLAAEVPFVPEPNVASPEAPVVGSTKSVQAAAVAVSASEDDRFYSPLVKNIAKEEGLSAQELAVIPGTGSEGRVTKKDILAFVAARRSGSAQLVHPPEAQKPEIAAVKLSEPPSPATSSAATTTTSMQAGSLVEMSRMGKLIAKHMVESVQTSAHVQSFIEVDVTKLVAWRNKVKSSFEAREGEKFTFTPIFMEAVALALKQHPGMNISLEGSQIRQHKNINVGMAAALPDGNLIVPVIKNADQLNLTGMAKVVNDLAARARNNALKPDEIQGGTYTVTNVGSFGSVFGTPIINQPQVGILALGAIRKMPAVIETSEGDFIGIRSKMFLSHSYDHRVVNGALGGMFIKTIADYLESWDPNRTL